MEQNETATGWIANQLEDVSKRQSPGTAPGVIPSDRKHDPTAAPVSVKVIQFDASQYEEVVITDLKDIHQFASRPSVTWVNVDGLRDTAVISEICSSFGIHGLVVEDIVHPHQRAKVEWYDDHAFIVARMPEMTGGFDSEQISLVLCGHAVLSFQEKPGDCLEPVRERLRKQSGRIRSRGNDYLVYAMIDAIVDAYFPVLAKIGERLEEAERELTEAPSVDAVATLQRLRTILFMIQGTASPHLDAVAHLLRDQQFIRDETRVYLRDCEDHVQQVLDACETTRELAADLRDYCFAEISFNQNETMKTLTVMASVFIPLSFIAGLYGMNFDPSVSDWNMPETRWRYGYAFAIFLMSSVALVTLGGLRLMALARRKARRARFHKAQRILD